MSYGPARAHVSRAIADPGVGAIYSATALVDDPAPPVLQPAVVSAGWHSGVERVDVVADDASGVKSLSVNAGATKVFERQLSCDYTRMQPCPGSARETVSV